MPQPDHQTQIFIVRIWNEPREIERAKPEWRGVIEHVPSGEQRYFKHLDELKAFIVLYVKNSGVKEGWRQQLKQWLKR